MGLTEEGTRAILAKVPVRAARSKNKKDVETLPGELYKDDDPEAEAKMKGRLVDRFSMNGCGALLIGRWRPAQASH